MRLFYDVLFERGFSHAVATSVVNAFFGMLIMMTVIILHRGFLFIKDMKGLPEEQLTGDNKEKTRERLLHTYWNKKEIYLLFFLSYVLLFAANYFIKTII